MNYLVYSLSLLLLLVFYPSHGHLGQSNFVNYYLDSTSTCVSNCGGSEDQAFSNFKEAISSISNNKDSIIPYLNVNQGDYFGIENNGIKITIDINIVSTKGSLETTIDCQGRGSGFVVEGPISFTLIGFTIKGCNAGKGAAIHSSNLITELEDIVFIENTARVGSAIYSSSKIFNMDSCMFYLNKGGFSVHFTNVSSDISNSQFNMNANDVYCEGGNIISSESQFGSTCNSCSILGIKFGSDICGSSKTSNPCNFDGVCQKWIENFNNCPADCPFRTLCKIDGVCHSKNGENAINCPSDCDSDSHPGWKLESFDFQVEKPSESVAIFEDSPKKVDSVFLPFCNVRSFMAKKYDPVSGRISSNVIVSKDGDYYFRLATENIGAIVFVNGRVLFDTFSFHLKDFSSERKLILVQDAVTFIEVVFTSHSSNQRNIALDWRHESKSEYQPIPSFFTSLSEKFYCGDGKCNEKIPENCLVDCHSHIEKICPGQSPPAKLQDFYGDTTNDITENLLNNQYIFSLPGISFMSHGLDLRTGETNTAPLFELSYCDNTSFSIIQDPYRGLVYSVPSGLFAQVAPKCTMDSTTKTYSNSKHMASEESKDMSLDVSASGGGGTAFVQVSVSASLSLSKSTKSASDTESKKDGSISKTTISCETTKVHIVEHRFHPKFIQEVSNSFVDGDPNNSNLNLQKVIKKYGSTYLKFATFGGKIEVITVVDHSFSSIKSSSEVANSMEMSVSAQVSSKVLSGSVSSTQGRDSKTDTAEQNTFEDNSERSTMQIYGGQPGSYGKEDPNSFATWAKTVDLVPYPIDFKVGYVADILPDSWFFKDGHSVKMAWLLNEWRLFKDYLKDREFKYIKYEDHLEEEQLKRSHTIYHMTFKITESFDLEITNSKSKVFFFKNVKKFGATLQENMIIDYDDTKGVSCMKFIALGNYPKNKHGITKVGDTYYHTPVDNFQAYNIFTSRYYNFTKSVDSVTYQIEPAPFGKVILNFNKLTTHSNNQAANVDLMLYGTLGKIKYSINMLKPPLMPIELDAGYYLGKILGISFKYFTDPNASFKDYIIRFESLIVIQGCPEQISSLCVPKNNYYNSQTGFVNSFEAWRKPQGENLITIPYSETQQSVWVRIEPLGS
ncbi:hypothetical protein CYY_005006 [Polysphondylium violaceum]|uniref:MACPF domain-containing protein n=1 Tax=Polysphondylium violaceum TaxID=133409 RepID=A0A8J4PX90_9MYCE|nr:hypothetical protein CYY_005006 [Polysphondylium violaceum]